MPTARQSLLEAAHTAVRKQPWTGVRMVDVAARAGVSRQTLYNEFGSKEGLGAALVDGLVQGFLDGAAEAARAARRRGAGPAGCCSAAADWMLRAAHEEPIVRAALTGCWTPRMPLPAPVRRVRPGGLPADPGELATVLCERTREGLPSLDGDLPQDAERGGPETARAYEVGLRVALSYVVAPSRDESRAAAQPERAERGGRGEPGEPGEWGEPGERGPRGYEEPCGRVYEVVRALLATP
ncbi:TetR/AcrR family transcriptional regulator [Streptomyces sp. AJS327]|uniref:TetR/AcrR family transcriptional regulator n=1 Tax=Streptomyces sp. AJS327 TaxID=2545265 RepID=UPI0015DDCD62|nr:TetR/AcrR family transcriptional regulator [Streptomyces sp. AJS327]MBA0051493.1 TetR/AcrR family transcriptional regulator [Streptomyces sp. AJS327]